MVISPFARPGYIDHQTLSFDAYLKFIEDDFLGGQRIDPATDGRPDSRPDVRENAAQLGNLTADFDFSQTPPARSRAVDDSADGPEVRTMDDHGRRSVGRARRRLVPRASAYSLRR
jgi:hypothetical protein